MYMFIGHAKNNDFIIITDIEGFDIKDGILRLYKAEKHIPLLIDDFANFKLKYIEKGDDVCMK